VTDAPATLKSRLQADLTAAMKERDDVAKATLRMALAAVSNAEVAGDAAVALSDEQVLAVLQAEAKKRAEAAEIYASAGRAEQAAAEQAELVVLQRYLPAALSDDDLAAVVAEVIAEQGATGMSAMGGVVKAVRERVGSTAEGGRIAAAVKAALA
jgi:uncharacterized protein YqeY